MHEGKAFAPGYFICHRLRGYRIRVAGNSTWAVQIAHVSQLRPYDFGGLNDERTSKLSQSLIATKCSECLDAFAKEPHLATTGLPAVILCVGHENCFVNGASIISSFPTVGVQPEESSLAQSSAFALPSLASFLRDGAPNWDPLYKSLRFASATRRKVRRNTCVTAPTISR
jgi:hypothetical protein